MASASGTQSCETRVCPICGESRSAILDQRQRVPIAQNLMFWSAEVARNCPTGKLDMRRCMTCGFSWNVAFDPGLLKYDASYENDQSLSPAFEQHLQQVARIISEATDPHEEVVAVEVGCGQGYFLHRMKAMFGDRLSELVGFDPAYRSDSPIPPGSQVEQCYFDPTTCARLAVKPTLIVTRHVIEHVADPLLFLRAIRDVCVPETPIFVETPDIQWILNGAVAHDLYYEHCSLFDAQSLALAMELAGFEVDQVRPMLDGQYLFATGRSAATNVPARRSSRPDNASYPARRQEYVQRWQTTFEDDLANGETIALWGGASKGVTLALLLGEALSAVAVAIDINPARQGGFMPVSALPVVSPETARAAGVTKAYVMNPAYFAEIEQSCRDAGWALSLRSVA